MTNGGFGETNESNHNQQYLHGGIREKPQGDGVPIDRSKTEEKPAVLKSPEELLSGIEGDDRTKEAYN